MFCVNRKKFFDACSVVSKAIPSRTTMPILQSFKITVFGDFIEVYGCDLETSISINVPTIEHDTGKSSGSVCIDSKTLVETLRVCNDGPVVVEKKRNGNIKLTAGDFVCDDFCSYPTDGYPSFQKADHKTVSMFNREELASAMSRANLSAADAPSKNQAFDNVFINKTVVCASDGKRMAASSLKSPMASPTLQVAINFRLATMVTSMLKSANSTDVSVSASKSLVTFESDDFTISTRLSEVGMLPHDQVIPKSFAHELTVIAGDFMAAISQASVMADVESNRISMTFQNGTIGIRAISNRGSASSTVEYKSDNKIDGLTFLFDPTYFKEMLRTIPSNDVLTLKLNDPNKAVAMSIPNGIYIVVPLVANETKAGQK